MKSASLVTILFVCLVSLLVAWPGLIPSGPHGPAGAPRSGPSGEASLAEERSFEPTRVAIDRSPVARSGGIQPYGLAVTQSTLDLINGTLVPGNYPVANGFGPSSTELMASGTDVLVGSIFTNVYSRLNLTTDLVDRGLSLPSSATGLANNSGASVYYATDGNEVVAFGPDLSEIASVNLGVATSGVAVDPSNGDVFVTEYQNDTVAVLPANLGSVIATIGVGSEPEAITFVPGASAILVADFGTSQLSVIDPTTLALTGNLSVGKGPNGFYFDPGNAELYVDNGQSGNTTVLDASTLHSVAGLPFSWTLGGVARDASGGLLFFYGGLSTSIQVVYESNNSQASAIRTPEQISIRFLTFAPTVGDLYVANTTTNGVDLYDVATDSWVGHIATAITPTAAVFDPALQEVVVAGQASSNLSVISTVTQKVVATAATGLTPWQMAYDSADGTLYVAGGCAGGIGVVNASSYRLSGCLNVTPSVWGLAYDGRTGHLFATNDGSDVYDVDPATGAYTTIVLHSSLSYGAFDQYDAYDPQTGDVYVSNANWNNVSVINGSSDTVIGGVPVGTSPSQLAYDPLSGEMLVTDGGGSYVNRINTTSLTSPASFHVGNGPWTVSVDAGHARMYVGYYGSGNVTVWNATTYAYEGSVPTGSNVRGVTSDPASDLVFTANWGSANVTVINATSLQNLGSIDTGAGPTAALWDPVTGAVVIANGAGSFTGLNGGGSLSILTVALNSLPAITSFVASPTKLLLGQPVDFSVTAASGIGILSYAYSGLPPGCASLNATHLNCTPTAGGRFLVTAQVRDQAGHAASATVTVSVGAIPSITSFAPEFPTTDTGLPTTLTTNATGGIGPLTYDYLLLPNGCSSKNASTIVCAPSGTGTSRIVVDVTDALGDEQTAQTNLTVVQGVTISSLSASPTTIRPGEAFSVAAAATGGVGTLSYAFSNASLACKASGADALNCTAAASGNYTVSVEVTDSLGDGARRSVNVTVLPANSSVVHLPSNPAGQSGLPSYDWLAIGAAAVVAALVAVLVVWRRRATRNEGTRPETPG